MRHPLVNPSLAPYGFVLPSWGQRLRYESENPHWVNTEEVIARFWDKRNRLNAPRPLPARTIIHDILPGLATANRITGGDFVFDGLPYLGRDILVLSSAMQWFGTSVGRCFLEDTWSFLPPHHPEREFLVKLEFEREKSHSPVDLAMHFTHVCNARCRHNGILSICSYDARDTTARDRALVGGLMRWLGRTAGREFIAAYKARKERVLEAARERSRKAREEKRAKQHAA